MRKLLALVATLGLLVVVSIPAWAPASAAPPAQRGEVSLCSPIDPDTGLSLVSRVVTPSEILDCESSVVSVTVGADCGDIPLHIVINIDRSGSMVGQPIEDVKNAGRALVRALDMPNHPQIKVGLVSHGDPAVVNSQLTDREGQILGQIGNLRAGGEDNLPDSIGKSYSILLNQRRRMTERPVEVMVVLSDGGQTYPPQQGVQAAGRPKGDGVLMVGICADNGTPGGCQAMQQIATSRRYYFQARGTAGLAVIFTGIAEDVSNISLRSLTMEEKLPPGLSLVPGSVSPAPAEIVTGALQTTLKWQFNFPARQETVAYSVMPSAITTYILATTDVAFRDSEDRMGSLVVPTKPLTVTGPCLVPTNTPTPTDTPTPTFTPTPTNTPTHTPTVGPTDTPTFTPTPTNTPTPTFTPTPVPGTVFLPILNPWMCVAPDRPADVALVIDASSSMNLPTVAGRPKIEAAKDAARLFVSLLRPVDQAAIIAFNDTVTVHSGLTADQGALAAAIDAIATAPWTRIDLALDAAAAELASPRARARHLPVIVLMTDGHPTHTTTDAVREAGARARTGETLIYTIGVGPDLEPELMAEVAGAPERYYGTDDAENLIRIFGEIARKLPCVPPWEVGQGIWDTP